MIVLVYFFQMWFTVLIDTWWNVNNISRGCEWYSYDRFNRYMVECESNIKG